MPSPKQARARDRRRAHLRTAGKTEPGLGGQLGAASWAGWRKPNATVQTERGALGVCGTTLGTVHGQPLSLDCKLKRKCCATLPGDRPWLHRAAWCTVQWVTVLRNRPGPVLRLKFEGLPRRCWISIIASISPLNKTRPPHVGVLSLEARPSNEKPASGIRTCVCH